MVNFFLPGFIIATCSSFTHKPLLLKKILLLYLRIELWHRYLMISSKSLKTGQEEYGALAGKWIEMSSGNKLYSLSLIFSKRHSNILDLNPSLLTSRMTCCSSSCSTLLWISSNEGTRVTLSSLCSISGLESANSSELSTCCPVPALTGGVGVKATEALYNFLLWLLDFPVSSEDPTPAFLLAVEHTEEESEFPWENTDSVPSAGRFSSPRSPSPKPSSDFRNDCSRISSET